MTMSKRVATRRKDDLQTEPADVFADRKRLGDLIETATTSPLLHLDDRALSSIKSLVRASDNNVHVAFNFLVDRLKKNHSQVRYLAVLLIDELFIRSKLFRSLLVPVFETFLSLSVGFRAEYPLPPPEDRAALLRKKSIELVEKWKDSFGQHYKPVRLAYDYLKKTLRLEFPNAREVAALAGQQRREREQRTQELLKKKFQTLKLEFPDLMSEAQSTLEEIEECLKILVPEEWPTASEATLVIAGVDEDEEFEEYGVESLRLLRDKVDEQNAIPHESRDNMPVFDTLRDLYKILTTRHLVSFQECLTTLMRVDPEGDRQSRDTLLRETIDFRNQMLKTRDKCDVLGIQRIEGPGKGSFRDDLDEVIWEEGEVLISDTTAAGGATPLSASTESITIIEGQKDGRQEKEVKTEKKEADSIRQDLIKQAPVLPYGSFLDNWGSQSAVPANPRGLEYENHWGKVNYDVMIPADKIAELSIRASYYKPLKIEIPPCSAPLRKGGLCQRRDLRRCPLHGPIIPRDEKGNSIPQEAARRESRAEGNVEERIQEIRDDDLDILSDILAVDPVQLAEKAIENVRKKEEEGKTLARKQRAKRAREHNDACLREAANARTRLGFGELLDGSLDEDAVGEAQRKKPRGGLTALLHKKPTSKDRLARRLLSGRVRDATVSQLTRDEEAAYRESFPNQWTMK